MRKKFDDKRTLFANKLSYLYDTSIIFYGYNFILIQFTVTNARLFM